MNGRLIVPKPAARVEAGPDLGCALQHADLTAASSLTGALRQIAKAKQRRAGSQVRVPEAAPHAVRIGISGWTYPPWRGIFYPPGLRQSDELRFASRSFSSIEINGSFYSLMRPESYTKWRIATPEGFVFAVKGSRFITHMLRLNDAKTALANFFASGLLCLEDKLGPILWQVPPTFRFDVERLRSFFELLPRTTRELAQLARNHDLRLNGRAALNSTCELSVRHALEVRHPSFLDPKYVDLLREYSIASCVADSAGLYPVIDDLTSDFVYLRLHGSKRLYTSGYSVEELRSWAARIERWALERPVYVYFDNDVKVRAPFDAMNLERLLRGQPPRRVPNATQSVTEEPRRNWIAWRPSPTRN